MQFKSLTLMAPAINGTAHSEAEMLGSAAWLWMQSPRHRELPIHALASLLIPAIKRQQFVLASTEINGTMQPVAFASWANFSAEAEARYLQNSARPLPLEDWNSGDRMWFIDWITPFGHSPRFARALQQLLPHCCERAFKHNAPGKVIHLHGAEVSAAQVAQWWAERPLPVIAL